MGAINDSSTGIATLATHAPPSVLFAQPKKRLLLFLTIMARSEDAIRRRALKRQRTEEEQRNIDRKDMEAAKRKKRKDEMTAAGNSNGGNSVVNIVDNNNENSERNDAVEDPMREVGAWKCPGCGNENFASRNWCNSKMCDERRPDHIAPPPFRPRLRAPAAAPSRSYSNNKPYERTSTRPPNHPLDEEGVWTCVACQYRNFASRAACNGDGCQEKRPEHLPKPSRPSSSSSSKKLRHDPETSKSLVWSKQADQTTLSKNQELRNKFQETGGEGMEAEEVERAKVLITRDERKRQKRLQNKEEAGFVVEEEGISKPIVPVKIVPNGAEPTEIVTKAQKKLNKRLRKRYLAAGGKGMTEDEVERAKVLIARDERKRAKRASVIEKKNEETKEEK